MQEKNERTSAEWIASLCDQLAELVVRSGVLTGSYSLRMASLESSQHTPRPGKSVEAH
jgi:hypothetical protein